LKALKAPFPFLRLVPTGGVNLQTAASFLEAGASALGVGGDLVNAAALAEGKPELITSAARAYLDVVARTRAAAKAKAKA
jgi:2-dehydro-3-deoxyphosphogluconate aldolase/(4S)-4-hydroxy-2-oxoglutarate aldolase